MLSATKTLQALVDRIIPADDYPSGWRAGVGDFIERILATDLKSSAPLIEAGLDLLQQEAQARHEGADYADLPATVQDALIEDLLASKTAVDWGEYPNTEDGAVTKRILRVKGPLLVTGPVSNV